MPTVARLKSRDVAVKAVTKCGRFRVSVVTTRGIVDEALKRHKLMERTHQHIEYLRLFGTTISFTNLMASMLQTEERFKCEFVAAEATAVCESLALGECRAYVKSNPEGALVNTLKCDRTLYNQSKPVTSVTLLDTEAHADEASSDTAAQKGCSRCEMLQLLEYNLTPHAANFLARSDGVRTAVGLACAIAQPAGEDEHSEPPTTGDGSPDLCLYSAGIMVQPIALSDAETDAVIPGLQSIFDHFAVVTNGELSSDFLSGQDLLTLATGDINGSRAVASAARLLTTDMPHDAVGVYRSRLGGGGAPLLELDVATVERTPLDFFCRCSRDHFVSTLRAMGQEALEKMLAEAGDANSLSSKCTFCAKVLKATREELLA